MKFHAAIPAKDPEASRQFYQVLGFSVVAEYEKPDTGLRITRLEHQGQVLELMSHSKAQEVPLPEMPELLHIGLIVDDLEVTMKNLESYGTTVLKPVTTGTMVKRFAFVADPSGFPVELAEAL